MSVVIPTYQSERTVGETISSALNQTYPVLEIVVCIDGATDASAAIAAAYGPLVRVVHQENRGLAQARNAAIAATHGDLIAILDADDVFLPPYVERAVRAWLAAGGRRRFVSSNAYLLSAEGILPHRRVFDRPRADLATQRRNMLEDNIATIFSVFPRAMWQELGGFSPELTAMEDYDFWARAVLSGWEVHFVTEPTALYRLAGGSMSSKGELMNDNNRRVRRRLLEQFADTLSPPEREFLELTVAKDWPGLSKERAARALGAGDVAGAAHWCAEAAAVLPSDRGLRLKAELLRRFPVTGRVYRAREARRLRETARVGAGDTSIP
ncbi:MAG: glycosyltransferase [Micrococcales bacterium]|nr:glycosyltransferase [Micrococcales bacterium]